MSDTQRLFTALVLSMLAIFGWNYFYVSPKMEKQRAELSLKQANTISPASGNVAPALNVKANNNSANNNADKGQGAIDQLNNQLTQLGSIQTREQVLEQSYKNKQRIKINTERLHGSINLAGGMVDDLTLSRYHQDLDDKSPEVILLAPRKTEKQYFLNTGWIGARANLPNDNSIWKIESNNELTDLTPVTISYNNGAGLIFKKTFSIDEKYMITVTQSVQNKTADPVSLAPFGVINRSYDMKQKQFYVSHEGMIAVADKKLTEAKYKTLQDDKAMDFKGVTGWIGLGDKYWLTSIIPQNSSVDKFDISFKYYQKDGLDRFQNDILSPAQTVAPNALYNYTYNIYAGAKQIKIIEAYKNDLKIDLFDRAIDFGKLYFLTKPILKLLIFFHSKIGNMGLSIMLLTVCIRLILFPLANTSYKSMARMKKHMPEINKMKERFKGDRQKQGTEMMKYYKLHKINPAAGCLPVLVQIPVFFSLYKVLYVTIEMRHEPFFWFIHDLSAKDPTNIFTLFGLAAWTVPAILPKIGILPILYSLSMMTQQKLNPPMADETQKIIMTWMPWIFLFIFANFASGLVVYWIWNNILSITQQYIITRKVQNDKNE